jgi:lysophospholipase L1-like esterase
MCVGINVYGAASLGPRSFQPAIIGFVQTVRAAHPEIPFVIMSPIYSPPRESTPNAVGFTLQAMRDEVATAVATLQQAGDGHLHYVNGLDIFGTENAHLLPDDLHPDAAGYRIMGQNFTEQVVRRFFS